MDLRSDFGPAGKTQCDGCGDWCPDNQIKIQGCDACLEFRVLCRTCAGDESFTDDSNRCAGCVDVARDPIYVEMEALAEELDDAMTRRDSKLLEETKRAIARLFEEFFRREIAQIQAAGGMQ